MWLGTLLLKIEQCLKRMLLDIPLENLLLLKSVAVTSLFRVLLCMYLTECEAFELLATKRRNTDSWAHKKHIKDYRIYCIEDSGYFPMLEQPQQFNATLMKAVKSVK